MSARFMILMTLALLMGAATAQAEQVITVTTTIVSAQQQADENARTGRMAHCRILNGRREGIGFSSSSPQQAIESCCFYRDAQRGRYRIVEQGVARGPRGWFAVIRYE
jgi:hypothetical protein